MEDRLKIPKICIAACLLVFSFTSSLFAEAKRLNIAVMEFTGKNVSAIDASVFADILRTEIVNQNTVNVVDKANMDKVLAEAAFQQSGCTTSECAAQVGKILNVQKMIVGSLSKIEGTYCANANYVDVETGKIERSETISCEKVKEFYAAANSLAKRLVGEGEDLRTLRREKRPWFGLGVGAQYFAVIIAPFKHFSFELRGGGDSGITLGGGRINFNYGEGKISHYFALESYNITFMGLERIDNGVEVYRNQPGQMTGLYYGGIYNFSKKFGFCLDFGGSNIRLGRGGSGGSGSSSNDITVEGLEFIINMGIRYMF